MSFGDRINELEEDIAKLEKQLKAKDAIISEAVSAYSSLPPNLDNYALIETILGIRLQKQRSAAILNVQCCIHSMFTYDDFFYFVAEVNNDNDSKVLVSGICISSSADGTGYSETVVGIFDELRPVKFIEECSKRRLVISIRKGILMESNLVLEIEFQLVSKKLLIDPRLIPYLPTIKFGEHMRGSVCFSIREPTGALFKGNIVDISFEEGVLLYQALCTSFYSRYVELQVAQLNPFFNTMDSFKIIDFGDWQLVVGSSVHEGLLAICSNSSFVQSFETSCRIFAKDAINLERFERILKAVTNNRRQDHTKEKNTEI